MENFCLCLFIIITMIKIENKLLNFIIKAAKPITANIKMVSKYRNVGNLNYYKFSIAKISKIQK